MSSETPVHEAPQQDTTISFKSSVTVTEQGLGIENLSNMSPLAQLGCVDLIRQSIITKHFPSLDNAEPQSGEATQIEG